MYSKRPNAIRCGRSLGATDCSSRRGRTAEPGEGCRRQAVGSHESRPHLAIENPAAHAPYFLLRAAFRIRQPLESRTSALEETALRSCIRPAGVIDAAIRRGACLAMETSACADRGRRALSLRLEASGTLGLRRRQNALGSGSTYISASGPYVRAFRDLGRSGNQLARRVFPGCAALPGLTRCADALPGRIPPGSSIDIAALPGSKHQHCAR